MDNVTSQTIGRKKNRLLSARKQSQHRMLLWIGPPIAWFTVFMLIPYGMLFYYSLGRMEYLTFHPGLSIDNFVKIFTQDPYASVLLKSAKLGLFTAIFSSILAYPVAFVLSFYISSNRAKYFVYLLVILPWWASYLVKAYAWKTILGTSGIINAFLIKFGLISEPLSLFLYNQFSVTLTLTYIFTPFAILSIYAQLERIPYSLIEAAQDAGANGLETFYKIILPISVPGILAGAMITFSLSFGDFIAPALVGGPDAIMIANIIMNLLGVAFDWPMAATIGLFIISLALLLISAANHLERKTSVRL
jgi:spermidine/putrescine transport system permease protein